MRRSFCLLAVLSFVILSCKEEAKSLGTVEDNKPNFVFLFADDQTFRTINALGFDEVYTPPNLDRLVHNGSTFSHTYNMEGGTELFVLHLGL